MVVSIQTCVLLGLEPHLVTCEVDLALQIPHFTLVGLPSALTQESKERVRAAVVNSGFDWPARKITVNLLPASLPKWGTHFELAMALGILGAAGTVRLERLTIFTVGELSLSGKIRPCGWASALARWLMERGRNISDSAELREPLLILAHPEDIQALSRAEPELAKFCELAPVDRLEAAVLYINSIYTRDPESRPVAARAVSKKVQLMARSNNRFKLLSQVNGEPLGVVAALVALTGRFHALFVGPQGTGKSMLVRSICDALSSLSKDELADRDSLLGSFGESFLSNSLYENFPRPTVYLQTSITRAALEGALLETGQVFPGELTRAHHGVIVADEFLELRRDVLEAFRQPLEEKIVRLQRAKFRTRLPASFQFLATANLCPCGHYSIARRNCRCFRMAAKNYQMKLSGPILDRFDLVVSLGQNMPVPVALADRVGALLDPIQWERRLERASSQPVENISERAIPSQATLTRRGQKKIMDVAPTLAHAQSKSHQVDMDLDSSRRDALLAVPCYLRNSSECPPLYPHQS